MTNYTDSTLSEDLLENLQETFNKEFFEIIVRLYNYFQDYGKVNAWLYTKNPMLGNIEPMNMVYLGRGSKVLEFIKSSEDGNLA